jgi:hypothetical protein
MDENSRSEPTGVMVEYLLSNDNVWKQIDIVHAPTGPRHVAIPLIRQNGNYIWNWDEIHALQPREVFCIVPQGKLLLNIMEANLRENS